MTKKVPVKKLKDKTILKEKTPQIENVTYYRCDTCGLEQTEEDLKLVDVHLSKNPDHAFRIHVEREMLVEDEPSVKEEIVQ